MAAMCAAQAFLALLLAAPGVGAESPWRDTRPLAVGTVRVLTEDVRAGEVAELAVEIAATYDNPFDPREIAVDATVTPPAGPAWIQPGFFMVPYTRSGPGGIPSGPGGWRVRFTPSGPGTWRVTVRAKDRSGGVASAPLAVEAGASTAPGFIRRAAADARYFAFDSGEPYLPVGLNVCWPERGGLDDYQSWFNSMGRAGANWARIWMIYWSLGLEGVPAESSDYHGVGVYNLANAWRLDEIFRLAGAQGIRLMLCLDSFNSLKASPGNDAWKSNPYARERGGPLAKLTDYWTDPEARRLALQRIRYCVARWGASPTLFAWEFWNEVDGTDGYDSAAVTAWHREMARALRALDPFHHLVTTSYGDPGGDANVWSLPELDFVQAHSYNLTDTAAQLAQTVARQRRFGKPVLVGEFGADVDEDRWVTSHGDPGGIHLATAAFAIPLAGAAGTPMLWYWGNYVARYGLWKHFAAVKTFLAAVDWPGEGFTPVPADAVSFRDPPPAGRYREVTIRPDDTGWESRQVVRTLRDDGTVEPAGGMSQYLYGDGKPAGRSPLVLRGDFREAAELAIRVLTVSDRATLVVHADGATVYTHVFRPGKGAGEWKTVQFMEEWKVYQNVYDRDYTARIPAGTREVRIENTDGDWLTFGAIRISPFRKAPRPPVDVYGLTGRNTALVYVKPPEYTWLAPKGGAPSPPAVLHLPGLRDGAFTASLIATATGEPVSTTTVEADPAGITLPLPAIATDLAVRVDRVRVRPLRDRLRAWRARFEDQVRNGILAFWLDHGPDAQFGGFHGGLDRQGRPDPKAAKSLVEQSRVVYAFSSAYARYPDDRYRVAAKAAVEFFLKRFWDPQYGGWYWTVNRDGSPKDTHKYTYGESFAILALAEYGRVFADPRARSMAYVTFHRLDMHAHDADHGGYGEAYTRDWKPEPKGSPIDAAGRKSTNTHLHLLESFTSLLRLSGKGDVAARVEELKDLFLKRMTDPAGYAYEFFAPDWAPQTRDASYGHDVELAWLMREAGLATGRAPDDAAIGGLAQRLVDHALLHGYDAAQGGFWERGPGGQAATVRSKTWWAQAEGLVGLLDLYQATREERYLAAFEQTAGFVLGTVADREFGDWFPQFRADGSRDGDIKASEWKDPYHQTRACLEVVRRLDDLLLERP